LIYRIRKDLMYPHQRKWWELDNFIKLLVGGYGSGKTFIAAKRIIKASYINQGIPNQFVSPTYEMAKKTIIPTLTSVLDKAGIRYTYNKTDKEFLLTGWNGIIWVGSGENPDSLKGPNLGAAYIDEPFIQDREVFNQINARVRHPQANLREIGMTGTPEQLNWGYDLTLDSKIDIGIVRGSTRDAHALPKSYIENLLKLYTEEQVKAFIDGEFINLQAGRAVTNFTRDIVEERDNEAEMMKYYPVEFGIDFNVDHMTAEIFVESNGYFRYIDEIKMPMNSNTFEIAEAIKERYPKAVNCYPDASGKSRKSSSFKSDHQILRDAGFNIRCGLANPPVKDRVNTFISLIKNGRVSISPKCKNFIRDCEIMTWKNGELFEGSDHSLTHAFDSGTYPAFYKCGISRGFATSQKWTGTNANFARNV
jgi:PBSX family phage terminase large subunit